MKLLLNITFLCALMQLAGMASTVQVEDPYGILSITVKAQSSVVLTPPFDPEPSYIGSIKHVKGNVLTVTDSPNWWPSLFQTGQTHGKVRYILQFTTGPLSGAAVGILNNGVNSLTIDNLMAGNGKGDLAFESVRSGDKIKILKCWTYSTLFTGEVFEGAGISLVKDLSEQGDLSMGALISYNKANGWIASANNELVDDMPLSFGKAFIVRNPSAHDMRLTFTGKVPASSLRHNLRQFSSLAATTNVTTSHLSDYLTAMPTEGELFIFDNQTQRAQPVPSLTLVVRNGAWCDKQTGRNAGDIQIPAGAGVVYKPHKRPM